MTSDNAGNLPLTQAIAGLAVSKNEQKKEQTHAVAALDGAVLHRYGTGSKGERDGLNAMFHLAYHLGVEHPAVLRHVEDSSSGPSKSAHRIMQDVAKDICLAAGVIKRKDENDDESPIVPAIDPFTLDHAAAVLNKKWKDMVADWSPSVIADREPTDDLSFDDPADDDDDDDGPTFESIAAGGSEEATVTTTDSKAVTVFTDMKEFGLLLKDEDATKALVEKARAMLATKTSGKDPRFARVHHSKSKETFVDPEDRAAVIARFSSEEAFYDTLCESAGWDALRLKAYVANNNQRKQNTGRKYDCPAHQLLTNPAFKVSGVKNLVRILGAACLVNGGRSFYAARTAANVPESFVDAFLGVLGMDPSVAVVGAKNDRTWRWAYDPTGWDRTGGSNAVSTADMASFFL